MLALDQMLVRSLPQDAETGNRIRHVQEAVWSSVSLSPVPSPRLLAYSADMAHALDIHDDEMHSDTMLQALAGNALLPQMQAYATCYGGHQFGNWAGQLGDGRAIYLGEGVNAKGQRWELQLKGAGKTPYSRGADGRAVLRSSIREFLCSEAMHFLGVPTTRVLSLVATGDQVVRDMFYDGNPVLEPGAIVCRVAPSFTRFGHFEIHASRGDVGLLQRMIDFTIKRDFPELVASESAEKHEDALVIRWFSEVCKRTALMVAKWMQVGFVHGVMNTDNMSILGLTIDYGPYGWVDNFDPGWTPNTTDAMGRRYRFGHQANIARWNIERLADALYLVVQDSKALGACITLYDETYYATWTNLLAGKFGWQQFTEEDGELANRLFEVMTRAEVDYTLFFRALATLNLSQPEATHFEDCFYHAQGFEHFKADLQAWLQAYVARLALDTWSNETRIESMNRHNPWFVLRNYLSQQAIEAAEQGDLTVLQDLMHVMRQPYDEQPPFARFFDKRPDWAKQKAGCSSLSCSS